MSRSRLVSFALFSTLVVSSCVHVPAGGAPEAQLAAATTAVDVARVTQLLASGADPNKTVDVDGRQQSPWFLALAQLRPRQPGRVEIVLAMLKAGASPSAAWGTDRTGAKEPFWQKFWGPSRRAGVQLHHPLSIAMRNPIASVVRALIGPGFDPRDGRAVLAGAVEAGEADIVHMLVEAGVDVNTTANSTSPLLAAIETRNISLMTYLEAHGAREKP